MATIGDRIREKRMQQHLTQVELSRKLGCCKQNINRYESNVVTNIPLDKIMDMAVALDTTPNYLIGWDDLHGSIISDGHDDFLKAFASYYCKLSEERKSDLKNTITFMHPKIVAENPGNKEI